MQAQQQGRQAFADDLARRFDFCRQPENPYVKSDPAHHWWWVGLTDAMVEWFLT